MPSLFKFELPLTEGFNFEYFTHVWVIKKLYKVGRKPKRLPYQNRLTSPAYSDIKQ